MLAARSRPRTTRVTRAAGLYLETRAKNAHKAHVWGMYVAPSHRGRGLAGELLDAVVRHAETFPNVTCVHLGVTDAAPAARRVYERAGFRAWGTEPDALRHDGHSTDQTFMVLQLAK